MYPKGISKYHSMLSYIYFFFIIENKQGPSRLEQHRNILQSNFIAENIIHFVYMK